MPVSLSGSLLITGSLTTSGTLTAQTLVVQTVTSSIVYSSGSNIFGNSLTNTQQMTGSLRVTGSGNHYILGGNVGIGTSSPDALLRIDSNVASTTNNMLYLYNADYTGTTRSFIRIRNNITAGSTYSTYIGQGVDHKTYIIANDTSRNDIVINGDNGNVGIGTASPAARLQVDGSTSFINGTIDINSGMQMYGQNLGSVTTSWVSTNLTTLYVGFVFVYWADSDSGERNTAVLTCNYYPSGVTTISQSNHGGKSVQFQMSGNTLQMRTTTGTVTGVSLVYWKV